jgi:hypothetical protein
MNDKKQSGFVFARVAFLGAWLALVGILSMGCTQSPSPTPTTSNFQDVIISLQRTACYGTCPVYLLNVYSNGNVVYEGSEYVRITGKIESTISQEKVSQLVSEFDKADYFSLSDTYTNYLMTDGSTVTTSISIGGKTKTIQHYRGDTGAPKQLSELEDSIDEIVNSAQWIK